MEKTSTILDLVQGTPEAFSKLHVAITRAENQQMTQNLQVRETLTKISSQIPELKLYSERGLQLMRKGGNQINQALVRLSSVMNDLRKLMLMYVLANPFGTTSNFYRISHCSREILEAIARNT